jgi:hypothetical protein
MYRCELDICIKRTGVTNSTGGKIPAYAVRGILILLLTGLKIRIQMDPRSRDKKMKKTFSVLVIFLNFSN